MIQTTYPPCPDCGRPMALLRETEETTRGAPRTWWCADCTTHVRRHGDVWEILDLDADGRLMRRATPTGGAHWIRALQTVMADPRLHPSSKAVYTALLTRAFPHGLGTATTGQIAQWAGLSRVQVWHTLRELQQSGWVEWRGRRFRPGVFRITGPAASMFKDLTR
jgi:hypothetical protein